LVQRGDSRDPSCEIGICIHGAQSKTKNA
jgi:hypothetical protein